MKIISLEVYNLLSFNEFELNLDQGHESGITVVGPNGGGKSNLTRIIDFVLNVVDYARFISRSTNTNTLYLNILKSFAQSSHYDPKEDKYINASRQIKIKLLLGEAEKQKMLIFLKAALLSTLLNELGNKVENITQLEPWINRNLNFDTVNCLNQGDLEVKHGGTENESWSVRYIFEVNNKKYHWLVLDRDYSSCIFPEGFRTGTNVFQKQFRELLFGSEFCQLKSNDGKIPKPLLDFSFETICNNLPIIETGTFPLTVKSSDLSTPEFNCKIFRDFIEVFGGDKFDINNEFKIADLFSILLRESVLIHGESIRGFGISGTPTPVLGLYSMEQFNEVISNRNPTTLPLRLFKLKTGSLSEKQLFFQIQQIFKDITDDMTFDVQLATYSFLGKKISAVGPGINDIRNDNTQIPSQISEDVPQTGIQLYVVVNSPKTPKDLRIELTGSGYWEALIIADALSDLENKVLVLDEPAVSFHSTWQRSLNSYIASRIENANSQLILITHSPDLINVDKPERLKSIVRIDNQTGDSKAYCYSKPNKNTNNKNINNKEANEFFSEALKFPHVLSLLFAKYVVLLEGETELGALPTWFKKAKLEKNFDISFFSVGGDQNFKKIAAFLNTFKIPFAIFCDGKIFNIELNHFILKQVKDVMHPNCKIKKCSLCNFTNEHRNKENNKMNSTIFEEEKEIGQSFGVFTWATTLNDDKNAVGSVAIENFEDFLKFVKLDKQLKELDCKYTKSKILYGSYIAQECDCPKEMKDLFDKICNYLEA